MELEVVLIDCVTPKDLARPLPPSTNVVIYCFKRDSLSPPEGSVQLIDLNLRRASSLQRFYLSVQSEMELGYRLCQLDRYRPALYSSRADPSPFIVLGLNLIPDNGRVPEKTETPDGEDDVSTVLFIQLEEKVRSLIITNPDLIQTVKPASALAQIRNLALGILKSYQSRRRSVSVQLPQPAEMAEIIHAKLCNEGVLSTQQAARPQVSMPAASEGPKLNQGSPLVLMIKREGLNTYISGILQNPIGRAAKEKAARSQFLNYVSQLVQNYRRKQAVSVPDAEELTFPMFNHLKTIGVLISNGVTVTYSDSAIAALANSPSMKEMVVQATDLEADSGPVANLSLALLNTVANSYYRNVLLSEECKGKSERAIKEQIRTLAHQTALNVLRENPRAPVPSEEGVTEAIYQALVREQAIVMMGSEMRYRPDNIYELGRKLESLSLFSESDVTFSRADVDTNDMVGGILAEMRKTPEIRLGTLYDSCIRKALSYVKLDSKMPSARLDTTELALKLLHYLLTQTSYSVSIPPGLSLDIILQDIKRYAGLEVREAQDVWAAEEAEDA